MKALVLIGSYPREAGYTILRAYTTNERDLANKDLEMVQIADCGNKEWKLVECDFISDL